MSDRKQKRRDANWLLTTTDAQEWAHEFLRVYEGDDDVVLDEGFMIAWFANAIETGRTAGQAELGQVENANRQLTERATENAVRLASTMRQRDKAEKVLKLIRENSEDPEAVWRAAQALGEWEKA